MIAPRAGLRLALCLVAAGCLAREPAPNTLVILIARDVEGLDPHTAGGVWQTQTVLANLYEGLVAFDPEMRIVPALASAWTNPDDLTWEFQLRPGVRFHTGGTLEPEDVVYSLKRARDHPRSALRAALAKVEEISALPGGRVRIRTREPDASLAPRLRDVYVVSRRFTEANGDEALGARSCGTGPYLLVSRRAGTWVDLERFPSYWKGRASIPKARFLVRSYGEPDVGGWVPLTGRLIFGAERGTRLFERALKEAVPHFGPSLAVTYLSFDLRGPTTPRVRLPSGETRNPFIDPRVREAVALALDRARLRKDVASDHAYIPTQLVAPNVLGFDPSLPTPVEDKGRARRLMAETPFAGGFDVELDLRQAMARYGPPLLEQLGAAGIQVKLNALPEQDFFDRVSRGGSSLYVLRFSCRTGDAQEFFDKWVHSRDEARGYGQFNFSYRVNPVPGLDEVIEQARRELRPKVRLARLQEIMRRLMEARLAIPLLHERDVIFTSRDVEWEPRSDTFWLIYDARFR